MSWGLSIDFGTSNTAAAVQQGSTVTSVRFDRSESMSSAVLWRDGDVRVGSAANRARESRPTAFVASPKALLTNGVTRQLLDGQSVEVTDLVAAVLGEVRRVAVAQRNNEPPATVVLTHPVAWSAEKVAALKEAAEKVGFVANTIRMVPEPSAAAAHYARTGQGVAVGATAAVFDFGAGTCDVALIRQGKGDSTEILDFEGDANLGGSDFDDRILAWVHDELAAKGRADLSRFLQGGDDDALRALLTLKDSIRDAKEALTRQHQDEIAVRGTGEIVWVTLTRKQYEHMISADVARAADMLQYVLIRSASNPERIYLTGGASQTPLVHERITQVTGREVATLDDPKLVVALGAFDAAGTPVREGPALPTGVLTVNESEFLPFTSSGTGEVCFWSPSSPPSVQHLQTLGEVAREGGAHRFGAVNVDLAPRLAGRKSVRHLPTTFSFNRGRLGAPMVGAVPAETLRSALPPVPVPGGGPIGGEPPRGPRHGALSLIIGTFSLLLVIGVGVGVTAALHQTPVPATSSVTPNPGPTTPTPPPASVTCWDGSSADTYEDCATLTGTAAIDYVFGTDGSGLDCSPADADSDDTNDVILNEEDCTDSTNANLDIKLYEFDAADDMASYFAQEGKSDSLSGITFDSDGYGCRYSTSTNTERDASAEFAGDPVWSQFCGLTADGLSFGIWGTGNSSGGATAVELDAAIKGLAKRLTPTIDPALENAALGTG